MALMRFTEASVKARSTKGGLYAGASGDGNRSKVMESRASPPGHLGLDGRGARLSIDQQAPLGGGRMRPPLPEHGYRLAGTFPASAADGIVVTRPCVPVACAGTAVEAGAADAAAGIIPSALRTSASSFAIVSLFSFRKLRAFSRPCPMRSPL